MKNLKNKVTALVLSAAIAFGVVGTTTTVNTKAASGTYEWSISDFEDISNQSLSPYIAGGSVEAGVHPTGTLTLALADIQAAHPTYRLQGGATSTYNFSDETIVAGSTIQIAPASKAVVLGKFVPFQYNYKDTKGTTIAETKYEDILPGTPYGLNLSYFTKQFKANGFNYVLTEFNTNGHDSAVALADAKKDVVQNIDLKYDYAKINLNFKLADGTAVETVSVPVNLDAAVTIDPSTYVKAGYAVVSPATITETITTAQAFPQAAVITAAEADYTRNVDVTVETSTNVPVVKFDVQPTKDVMWLGGNGAHAGVMLTIVNPTVPVAAVYTSSDESVATVSANGDVTPVGKGNVTITVTGTNSGVSHTETVKLTVKEAPVEFKLDGIVNEIVIDVKTKDFVLLAEELVPGILDITSYDIEATVANNNVAGFKKTDTVFNLYGAANGETTLTVKIDLKDELGNIINTITNTYKVIVKNAATTAPVENTNTNTTTTNTKTEANKLPQTGSAMDANFFLIAGFVLVLVGATSFGAFKLVKKNK